MSLFGGGNSYDQMSRSRRRKGSFRGILMLALLLALIGGGFYKSVDSWRLSRALSRAKVAFNAGDFEGAGRELELALENSPQSPIVQEGLALVALEQGQIPKARQKFNDALEYGSKPNKKFPLATLGNRYLDQGRYLEAQIVLDQANRVRPKRAEILAGLGLALQAHGNLDAAIEKFQQAMEVDSSSRELQGYLDQAHLEKDKSSMDYIYDRNGESLARWQVNAPEGRRSLYPYGPFIAHLLGWNFPDNDRLSRGRRGLEGAFAGKFPGNKLHLSLDMKIERILSKALGHAVGAIVAVDPQTGDILGMVSQPTFNPLKVLDNGEYRNYRANAFNPLHNRAMEKSYDGGSISKVITVAAALDKNVELRKIFPLVCRRYYAAGGTAIHDWKAHRTVKDLGEAFSESCNVGFAQIGEALGPGGLVDMYNSFGFNRPMPFLPELMAPSPSTSVSAASSLGELAKAAAGLGEFTKLTPLHAALIAATIANGGLLPQARLIREVRNIRGGLVLASPAAEPARIMKAGTAQTLKDMMLEAVETGTGHRARVPGLQVAGKTATAGQRDEFFGRFDGWFICFAPVSKPEIALAVFLEHGGTGEDAAAPVAGAVLRQWLELPKAGRQQAAGGKNPR